MKKRIVALAVTIVVIAAGVGLWMLLRGTHSATNQPSKQDVAPTIQLDVPESSLLVSQDKKTIPVAVKSSNYSNIARVEYRVDGKFVAYSTTAPFDVDIDISQLSLGDHTLQAMAYSFSGKVGKSAVFTFTITPNQPTQPAGEDDTQTVQQSISIPTLRRIVKPGSSSGSNSSPGSSNDNSGGNNGGNNGGDNGGDNGDNNGDNGTAWPDTPNALVCDQPILNGLTSAPSGAQIVPAGDNSGVNFEIAGKTYWFAPGVHRLGNQALTQIEPGDNATFVGAPGAVIDGQGINQYAFTQHAVNVKIQYLTIKNFNAPRDEGVVNHDSGVGWTMEYNTFETNEGGAVFAGTNNVVRYNCMRNNGQYGFQVYSNDAGGPHHVKLDHNEISGNNTHDWESIINGCGCTGGGKFWEAYDVDVTNNYVHNNLSVGLWADTNDRDFLIDGNYISENQSQGLFYEISYNMIVQNNNFVRNALVDGPGNNSFPAGAIYLSEAGGDSRVSGRTAEIDIHDNNFQDNWAGIVLWENADRFCSSPANTSSGVCTIVNPLTATIANCTDPGSGGHVNVEPYYSDCRWKTQNVKVHNNVFNLTRSNITGCTQTSSCGYQGLFSNSGSFPTWSPYMGDVIQTAITFNQHNVFSNNTYLGDWKFKAKEQASSYNFALWQASPYSQDVGSTINGKDHLIVANAIDDDTATLEGSIGKWTSWFSSNVSQSTAEAHSGTHSLKVDITAPFGWGVQLTDPNGFPVTTTSKYVSFWGKLGTGTNLKARMEVQWLNASHNLLRTDTITSPILTSSWQKTTSPLLTMPAGAATANVVFVDSSGVAGNSMYIDDVYIADSDSI